MGLSFSDTTNKDGILQLIEQTCEMNDGAITGSTVLKARFTNLVNNWLHFVTHIIHMISNEWTYDDGNNTGFAVETYSCTDSQQDHGLDSDISAIKQVELHKATKTEPEGWFNLDFQLSKDRNDDRFYGSDGEPSKYWLEGGSIIWNVPIDIDKVDKYRITYDRHAHVFVVSDTTDEPGFDAQSHMILVYGPSMDWLANKKKPDVYQHCNRMLFGDYPNDKKGLVKMLKQSYLRRAQQCVRQVGRKAPAGGSWK